MLALVVNNVAPLTERQQQAAAIMAELQKIGGHVINPMPLAEDARLVFQVLDYQRDALLEKVSQWGWNPVLKNHGLRFDVVDYVARRCTTYEIDLPRDKQSIVDDRTIPRGELAERREKTPAEVEALRRYLSGSQR
jgi:hypothetical protein